MASINQSWVMLAVFIRDRRWAASGRNRKTEEEMIHKIGETRGPILGPVLYYSQLSASKTVVSGSLPTK